MKLKENDELISVSRINSDEVLCITKDGYALKYNTEEIPVLGLRTSGVKSIKLSENDYVINSFVINKNKEYVSIFTDKNTAKRIKIEEIQKLTRAKKGISIIKSPKSKQYNVFKGFMTGSKTIFGIMDTSIGYIKASDINIMDKQSTGSVITKKNINDIFVVSKLTVIEKEEDNNKNIEKPKEDKPKEKVIVSLTMSDFFEEFKI